MRRHRRLLLGLLLGGHLAGVVGLIGLGPLLDDQPVVHYDLGLHFYRAAILRESGGFPGLVWDPGYQAGYPVGGATDVDNRLGELGVVLLPFLPVGSAWNLVLMILFGGVPLLVFLGARWSGAEPGTQGLALFLATLLFWGLTLGTHRFVYWGMYGWVIFSAALPLLFGGLQRLLKRPGIGSVVALGLAATLASYAHGLVLIFLPALILVLLFRLRELSPRHFLALAISVMLTGLLVWPIVSPVLSTLGEVENPAGLTRYFQADKDTVFGLVESADRSFHNGLLLLCAVGVATRRLDRPQLELALIALATALASLFAFLPLPPTGIQPTRYLEPALFLAVLPASAVLASAWRESRAFRGVRLAAAALLLALAWPITVQWGMAALGKRALATSPSAEAAALVRYLREHTSPSTRLLVEDDGDHFGGNHFGKPHLLGYLAREIDRQLIGGPHPVTLTRVGSVTYVNGTLLGRPISAFSDSELRRFLTSYNIGTVVGWSDATRERFARLGLEARHLEGGFTVFQTELAGGFADGAESVRATALVDEIRVTGAVSSPTLLRWQWDPRFRTEPELPVHPVEDPHSPVGFILVENGSQSDFVVRFGG